LLQELFFFLTAKKSFLVKKRKKKAIKSYSKKKKCFVTISRIFLFLAKDFFVARSFLCIFFAERFFPYRKIFFSYCNKKKRSFLGKNKYKKITARKRKKKIVTIKIFFFDWH